MAFTPCTGHLAANITQDCDNPRISGYEDVAVIINRDEIDWTGVTYNSTNPRIVEAVAVASGKTPFVIYNPRPNPAPLNGTQTSFTQDSDLYTKTLQFYFEGIGGKASKEVVEPLKAGSYVAILQRKDHRGDGSFQIMGLQGGLRASAQVQDEETGYWLMTMNCDEPFGEMSFFKTDYATTKAMFDSLVTAAP